jgi:hypothetical protein
LKKILAKLNKVELREVWEHEAFDFTNWLSQQENLDALGEEIGIDIKLIQTEANVGKFNVDILAQEESSGRKIIIENQLADTNHDHLGKIITYASGYDAEIIIWIVRDFREEHQKAIEWLNEHTDEAINFFLIKIELWQIEQSNPAAKFEMVVSPNVWAKVIKDSAISGELTDTKIQQLEFWSKFKEFTKKNYPKSHFGQSPRPQHWYDVSMGSSDAHVTLIIDTRKNILRCELYINKDKSLFKYLLDQRNEIEKELGDKIEWVDAEIASRLKMKKEVSNVFDVNQYDQYFTWLYEKTILFQKVFGRYLKEYKK